MTPIRKLVVLALCAAVFLGALVSVQRWAGGYYLTRTQESGRATLSLVTEAVDQAVGRFAPIPGLIAGDPALQQMLRQNSDTGFTPFISEKLRQIAIAIDASDVYVMDRTGRTVAASNYRDDDSFLGKDFAFRPYFKQSLAGKSAVFHALGTTSGERGFFFSAPILDGIEVLGVMAVKITVGAIESGWDSAEHEILIADNNGIVFLSSRQDYRFRALAPLGQAIRDRIAETQQYPLERVLPINLSANVIAQSAVQVTIGQPPNIEQYLAESTPLILAGWHAIVFTPLLPVQTQVYRSMALGGLALAALMLTGLLFLQRRANVLNRIRMEQEQRVLLEQKVRERTADLNSANISLREEVAERRNAEDRLRQSQKDLVQAGKLAALGQMSAAISHEINQPLAAIKSYADNATEFLARDRTVEAGENIKSISKMSDRMAEISRHLRTFARQPGDTLSPVNVTEVITETIGLVGPQLRASGAKIRYHPTSTDFFVLGGKLRLQQVLVNIINNALEAMTDLADPVVDIDVRQNEGQVLIAVRDRGHGISQATMEQVFDAFYTTKEAGAGMGLGMSISHNIVSDFGGSLTARNHPDGGAVFTVALVRHHGPDTEDPIT